MASIGGRNTKPELMLRRSLWALGNRYRIHAADVPGRPDLSHKGRMVAVFVDGCFWHGCPKHYTRPKHNRKFWDSKLVRNKKRRVKIRAELEAEGWRTVEIWECDVQTNSLRQARRVSQLLNSVSFR